MKTTFPARSRLEQMGERFLVLLRPRRFGKSLFVSTLQHYYDRNCKDEFEALFGRTYIGRHPTPLTARPARSTPKTATPADACAAIMKSWYDGYIFSAEHSERTYNSDMALYFLSQYIAYGCISKMWENY